MRNQQKTKRLNSQRIKRDLSKTLHLLGFQKAELSILFVNSSRIKLLNSRYRGINKVTDILSFPQYKSEVDKFNGGRKKKLISSNHYKFKSSDYRVLGDIVICIPQVIIQARDYDNTFYDELLRLLIHGLLHLLGYDHEKNTYQKRKMKKKERELLNALKTVA